MPDLPCSKAKFLVWSGDFLRKLDLSEVSFEDVVWEVGKADGIEPTYYYDALGHRISLGQIYNDYGVYKINLRGTNARVDFYSSFQFKLNHHITICHCDFEGTDLSKNILGIYMSSLYQYRIGQADFSNTGIKVTNEKIDEVSNGNPIFIFVDSSFVNCDFSSVTITPRYFIPFDVVTKCDYYDGRFVNCDLRGTGMQIKLKSLDEKGASLLRKHTKTLREHGIKNPYQYTKYQEDEQEPVYADGLGIAEAIFDYKKQKFSGGYNEKNASEKAAELKEYNEENYLITALAGFNLELRKCHLCGCRVNGKLLLTKEESDALKAKRLKEYKDWSEEQLGAGTTRLRAAILKRTKERLGIFRSKC